MRSYHIDIVTPDGVEFSGEIESLLVRTGDGDVEIMAGHADFVASIGTGRARIIENGNRRIAACSGGFITVSEGEAKLVAITFEFSDNIDKERAKASKEKAENAIASAKDDKTLAQAKAKLARAMNRLSVCDMK